MPETKILLMSFRRRIFTIVFAAGIIPALLILALSVYLLNSTLRQVAASGLETSLETARSLVEESETNMRRFLALKLEDNIPWTDHPRLRRWLTQNGLDLAIKFDAGTTIWIASDSVKIATAVLSQVPVRSGLSHFETDGHFFLIFGKGDSISFAGCGVLMPADYAENGRRLAQAMSASASLGMYGAFSVRLLTVATGVTIGLVLVLGLIVSALISRQLVKPLEKLTDGARVIGSGNLQYRVRLSGNDEFARLAESFNVMAAGLWQNQLKLLDAERLAAWREVARRIAHEIRNPLTPMNIELFRLQERLKKKVEAPAGEEMKSLEAIRSQLQVLQDLAIQFSTFAKEPELKPIRCSIGDIVSSAAEAFASNPVASISINLPVDLPPMNLDAQMMGRVFVNLFKNSLEASPTGVRIDIIGEISDGRMKIIVHDNGPGFPKEKLARIDQPYLTTKKAGTGLGMAIVKKIIDEHGGQVRFYNDNGAVAEITLPLNS